MEQTTLIIIIATVFLFLILGAAALIIISAQKKRHELQVSLHEIEINRHKEITLNNLRSQEQERRRIGLDLHDELGPAFSVVKMNLGHIKRKLDKGSAITEVSELADETAQNLNQAIEKFSNLSKLLYPVILTRYGLQKAIEDIIERSFHNTSLNINADINEIKTDTELMTLSIYRVFQELIHNTLKHAHAKNVKMQLNDDDDNIHINYDDDGQGFDMTNLKPGLGLDSINGRIEAIGGNIKFTTAAGQGTSVTISIPHEK